jgi:hypothetical protein
LLVEISKRKRITTKTRAKLGALLIFSISLTLALSAMLSGVGGAVQATGTSFYVDSEGGNDSNSGTSEAEPWATIGRANALDLDPGDRLLFKGGEAFDGNLQLGALDAGTAEKPVVVDSYGGGRASIEAGKGKGVSIYNAGGVEVSNLIVTGAGRAAGSRVSGVEIYTDLGNATKLEHVYIENVEVSGFGDAGILLAANPKDATKSGFRDVRITNVSAHDNADAGINSFGYFSSSAKSWAHEDVYVGDSYAYNNRGIPDKGSNSGSGIVLGDVNDATIERCVSYSNGENNNYPYGGPVGIWTWDSNAVTIQHNESYDNESATVDGGGFDLDGGVTNSVMQYNYSHDNAGAGYLLYQFDSARPFGDNVVRYNVSENDGRINRGGISAIGVDESEVHNNTVYMGPRADGSLPLAAEEKRNSDVQFRNNMFVPTGGTSSIEGPYDQGEHFFLGQPLLVR